MLPSTFKSNDVGKSTVSKKVNPVVTTTPGVPIGYSAPDFSSGTIDNFSAGGRGGRSGGRGASSGGRGGRSAGRGEKGKGKISGKLPVHTDPQNSATDLMLSKLGASLL